MASTTATAVGTSAVEISSAGSIPFSVHGSQSVVVSNAGSLDMFIGGSTVTASGATVGVIVKAGTNLVLPALSGSLWAISTSTGTTAVVGTF